MKSKTEAYIALGQLTEQLYEIEEKINGVKKGAHDEIEALEKEGAALTDSFKETLAALGKMETEE